MIRSTEKLSQSHNRMRFLMQGSTEREEYTRTWPNPLPPGYRMAHRWDGFALEVWPEPIDAPPQEGKAVPAPTVEQVKRRTELENMGERDLLTYGAEISAGIRRNMPRAEMVARVMEAEAKRNAKPQAANG